MFLAAQLDGATSRISFRPAAISFQGIAKGPIRMNPSCQFKIEAFANEIFNAGRPTRIKDFEQAERLALAQVRATHDIGGYAAMQMAGGTGSYVRGKLLRLQTTTRRPAAEGVVQ